MKTKNKSLTYFLADEKMSQRFVEEVCSTEIGSTLNMCPQKQEKEATEVWYEYIISKN